MALTAQRTCPLQDRPVIQADLNGRERLLEGGVHERYCLTLVSRPAVT
jgi:hypothetical protein